MKKNGLFVGMLAKVTIVTLALTFGLVLAGCNGGSSALAGRWYLVEGPTYNNPEDMDLLKDGTGIIDKAGITWKTENGRFYVTHPLIAKSWSYTASGSTLTLTDDNGTVLKYKKR
jgi:hypothetical protein